jgi:nucleoside 2-deoxyribosyltransferase
MRGLPAMKSLRNQLEAHAACVLLPKESDIDWASTNTSKLTVLKTGFVDEHLAKIQSSDLALLANYTKNGIKGYIGSNTLMEIAFAYALKNPVVLLFDRGSQSCRLEVLGIADRVIDGNIRLLL